MSNELKRWGLYACLGVLIVILAVGAVSCCMGKSEREPQLSVRQAVKIFAQEGVQLTKTNDPDADIINEVKPTSYNINNTKHKLNIYRYDSIEERKKAAAAWRQSDGAKLLSSEPYSNAYNLMFTIIPADENAMTLADFQQVNKVPTTIFEKLNDTREIVYTGRSENWEAQTIVKYYEYFYNDQDATLQYENWHQESSSLKYLGQDADAIGEISYEKKRGSDSTVAAGIAGPTLKPDGSISVVLGASGGNGAIPRDDQEITWIIRWNGQEETFTARAQ